MQHLILEKLVSDGQNVEIGGSRTFVPSYGVRVFLVRTGCADLSVVPVRNQRACAPRNHLCSFEPGDIFLVSASRDAEATNSYIVSAVCETSLVSESLDSFVSRASTGGELELALNLLDRFITKLSAVLIKECQPKTAHVFLDDMTGSHTLATGQTCSCRSSVSWLGVNTGLLSYLDNPVNSVSEALVPLTPATWATAEEDSLIDAFTTSELFARKALLPQVSLFLRNVLEHIKRRDTERQARQSEQLRARTTQDTGLVDESLNRFSRLFRTDAAEQTFSPADPLHTAMSRITGCLGLPFSPSHQGDDTETSSEERLQKIAGNNGIRTRRVALAEGWWRSDCGPLIGFTRDDDLPVALVCGSDGHYLAYIGDTAPVHVTARFSEQLRYFACMLYRSFPDTPVTGKMLIKFGIAGIEKDLYMVVMMGLGGSLLSLAVPVVTGVIFDSVIPQAQRNQLWLLCMALFMCAAAGAVFDLTRRIALLRIESRMDQHIQGAVWDRLMKLPPSFFRQYSSGDLADRSLGISAIRQTFSNSFVESILAALFSLTSLALLFSYSFNLALVAIALALIAVGCITVLGMIQTRYQKHLAALRGELAGKILDLVNCIAKLKISGAEDRAFSRWAEAFCIQKDVILKARRTSNIVHVFTEIFPVGATMVIFSMIVNSKTLTLSVGGFLAFNTAFGQFVVTLMSLSLSLIAASAVIPSYARCLPIIEALPERDNAKEHPGVIRGDIEVSAVSFRYAESAPAVLNDVSFRIAPGQFIAVVGTSGGGKSTLTRLLLGFEKPSSGSIFYDGRDLGRLDVHQVRRQIGVVLQNGRLIAGDILSNIVGSMNLSIDHAWEAARLAGLDEDIQAMPMGMHTFLSEGGGNLSGGQRQRMLIARALVNKPSILIFDEATSALDNRTQAIVNESLESLRVTRIVIAHRLSTVYKADTIIVLDKGTIAESGTYNELMGLGGVFAELARRQVA